MFDAADLISLPELNGARNASSGLRESRVGTESIEVPRVSGEGTLTAAAAEAAAAGAAAASSTAVPTAQPRYVVEACAMGEDNVALAMSDGELCHTKLSRLTETVAEERQRPNQPNWASWRPKHGSVLHLQYDRAHDALVTLEVIDCCNLRWQICFWSASSSVTCDAPYGCPKQLKDAVAPAAETLQFLHPMTVCTAAACCCGTHTYIYHIIELPARYRCGFYILLLHQIPSVVSVNGIPRTGHTAIMLGQYVPTYIFRSEVPTVSRHPKYKY